MPSILAARGPSNIVSLLQPQGAGTAVADVLTYTVPAGRVARARWGSVSAFTLAPTFALQLVRGASTITLVSAAALSLQSLNMWLLPGDVLKWRCTAAVALSAADLCISVEEYESG